MNPMNTTNRTIAVKASPAERRQRKSLIREERLAIPLQGTNKGGLQCIRATPVCASRKDVTRRTFAPDLTCTGSKGETCHARQRIRNSVRESGGSLHRRPR